MQLNTWLVVQVETGSESPTHPTPISSFGREGIECIECLACPSKSKRASTPSPCKYVVNTISSVLVSKQALDVQTCTRRTQQVRVHCISSILIKKIQCSKLHFSLQHAERWRFIVRTLSSSQLEMNTKV